MEGSESFRPFVGRYGVRVAIVVRAGDGDPHVGEACADGAVRLLGLRRVPGHVPVGTVRDHFGGERCGVNVGSVQRPSG